MRLNFCAACGSDESLEHHHLIPRSKGGGDEDENIITLCSPCHGKAHGISRGKNLKELTRIGLQNAKARGVRLGSPVAAETAAMAREARTAKAKAKAASVLPIIESIERAGVTTLTGIAKALEARGVLTPNGGASWQAGQVARIKAQRQQRVANLSRVINAVHGEALSRLAK